MEKAESSIHSRPSKNRGGMSNNQVEDDMDPMFGMEDMMGQEMEDGDWEAEMEMLAASRSSKRKNGGGGSRQLMSNEDDWAEDGA